MAWPETIAGPVSAQNKKLVASPKIVPLNRLNRAGSPLDQLVEACGNACRDKADRPAIE